MVKEYRLEKTQEEKDRKRFGSRMPWNIPQNKKEVEPDHKLKVVVSSSEEKNSDQNTVNQEIRVAFSPPPTTMCLDPDVDSTPNIIKKEVIKMSENPGIIYTEEKQTVEILGGFEQFIGQPNQHKIDNLMKYTGGTVNPKFIPGTIIETVRIQPRVDNPLKKQYNALKLNRKNTKKTVSIQSSIIKKALEESNIPVKEDPGFNNEISHDILDISDLEGECSANHQQGSPGKVFVSIPLQQKDPITTDDESDAEIILDSSSGEDDSDQFYKPNVPEGPCGKQNYFGLIDKNKKLLVNGSVLTASDLYTLSPSTWLNDKIINAYFSILEKEARTSKFFSTFFLKSVVKPKYKFDVSRVGNCNKNKLLDLNINTCRTEWSGYDNLVFPIHLGSHWCLFVYKMRHNKIWCYDSLGYEPNQKKLVTLQGLLGEVFKKKIGVGSPTTNSTYNSNNLPLQKNGDDCGVFTCMYAKSMTRLGDNTDDTRAFRNEMLHEIMAGKIIYKRKIKKDERRRSSN